MRELTESVILDSEACSEDLDHRRHSYGLASGIRLRGCDGIAACKSWKIVQLLCGCNAHCWG
jgi:hypothetical protein